MKDANRRTVLGVLPILALFLLALALTPMLGLFRLFGRCSSPIPLALLLASFVSLLLAIAMGIGLFGWISAVALLGAIICALADTTSVVHPSNNTASLPKQGYRW